MHEAGGHESGPGRARIVGRPRLTRLLDETAARVVVLVAPAGYGKTTLAREWLAARDGPSAWYTAGPAASDVAALGAGLAAAASAVVPGAGRRLCERLPVTDDPEREVALLAGLLAEGLAGWPADAVLVVDDYHLAAVRPTAERLVETLLELAPVRMLVAGRARPSWATAKRVLAGEILELTAAELAMTRPEVGAVLGDDAAPWITAARGWPAVIGLAALSNEPRVLDGPLPPRLFEYVAEEIYRTLDAETRDGLELLSLCPAVDTDLCAFLVGPRAGSLVDAAIRAGFLARDGDRSLDLHPLLRAFLRARRAERPDRDLDSAVEGIVSFYAAGRRWDDAFAVLVEGARPSLLAGLLGQALDDLLAVGRLTTVEAWLRHARENGVEGAAVELAQAHVDQRRGRPERAELLALRAADALPDAAGALLVAARAAHFAGRPGAAVTHLERARGLTRSPARLREIAWLAFCAALEVDVDLARERFDAFCELDDHGVDTLLQTANGRLVLVSRSGGLGEAVERDGSLLDIVDASANPVTRTAYLNSLAHALVLLARYAEAGAVAERQVREAESSGLVFVLPYAWLNRGLASYGVRAFGDARTALDRALGFAERAANGHAAGCCRAALAGLLLAEGAAGSALECARPDTAAAEADALRGLALAVLVRRDEALRTLALADSRTRDADVAALTAWARAVVDPVAASDAAALLVAGADRHAFVTAYRAHPPLLAAAAPHLGDSALAAVLEASGDHALARAVGIAVRRPPRTNGLLTRREREVYELLAEGRRNTEIAQALFISPGTVKAHVRSIFDKLGVRSRTQAAALRARVLGEG